MIDAASINRLQNILDKCADEGDRVYFASTNDFDDFKRIVQAAYSAGAFMTLAVIPSGQAVCMEGKWRGWLVYRHPDGQWVSLRKFQLADPLEGSPLLPLAKKPEKATSS